MKCGMCNDRGSYQEGGTFSSFEPCIYCEKGIQEIIRTFLFRMDGAKRKFPQFQMLDEDLKNIRSKTKELFKDKN